ncbi:ClpP-like prohead protease/major capsid protein fusion protein [Salinicola salarius]|uniref:ClpP-like prohead protease/major capsid protein fusion protein n=1 Tax=Salinicola salarius TaxID=430457 RepID=UPI001ABF7E52|nr:ClpP-like prohead protease/major capsid protein fusion protein [Salinicola salarius]
MQTSTATPSLTLPAIVTGSFARPMAMAATTTAIDQVGNQTWYMIRAVAQGVAEIAIYDEIGAWGVTAKQFSQDLKAMGEVQTINLHIHSPGGDVFEGMAIYNLLANHPATINVYIDGLAASMASVIAMVGNTVYIPENAMIMIHKPWGIQGGNSDDMRRYAELLDKVETTLLTAYTKKTGKTEDEIRSWLAAETWLSGPEAVEHGFADQLVEPLAMAASLKSKRLQEFEHMPDALKNLLAPRAQGGQPQGGQPAGGQPQGAQPQGGSPSGGQGDGGQPQGGAPASGQPQGGSQPAPTMQQFQEQERARRDAVRAVFQAFPQHNALRDTLLDDMSINAEAAREQLLAKLGASTEPTAPPRTDHGVHAGNGNIVGDGIRNAIAARVQLDALEKDNAYAGMTLMEMARASLTERGVGIASLGGDRMSIAGAAFTHTSSDFGHLLADVARRQMLKGYDEAEETFQKWTAQGSLPDFRPMQRVDLTTFPSLRKVREGAEYKYASVGDRGEQIMLATYGELLSITRQAIINDDLSALQRIPRMMGRAAIRTVGDLVYALLGSNPTMGDNKKLFSADRGNQLTAGALSIARIDQAKTMMATQKEGNATLNIRPKYHLTPVSMESTTRALYAAEFDPAMAEARVPNPVRGLTEVIADARLDDQSKTTSYMTADPNQFDTIEVAYLDGNSSPYLEQQQGFTVDGAVFKVRMDAGVAPLSYRTLVKLPGN